MKKLMTVVLAGVLVLAFSARPVRADEDDDAPPPKKAAPKAVAGALTDESLGALLEKLGYEAKAQTTKTGIVYSIEFTEDDWTFRYTVLLSPNKKFLWVSTGVCTLSQGSKMTPEALLRLLEENDRIGPTTISYDKQYKQIRAAVALYNRGITAGGLREQMGFFTNNVKAVAKLCDGFKAPAKPKKAPKPPVDDDDDK
jgi:hypothetical protein